MLERVASVRWVAPAGALFTLAYAIALTVQPPGTLLHIQSNVIYNIPAFVAFVLSVRASRVASVARERWGWALLATMLLSWQMADWVYTYHDFVLGTEPPFPGIADIPYTAGYLAFSGALPILLLPGSSLRFGRWLIDAVLVMTVAAVAMWTFVMEPIVAAGDSTRWQAVVALSYPVYDLGLAAIVVLALIAARPRSMRARVLLAAVGIQILTDVVYSYSVTSGTYQSYGDPLEIGWVAVYVLIAIAVVAPDHRSTELARRVPVSPLGIVTPYAVALPLVLIAIVAPDASNVVMAGGISCVALIIARQILSARETARLYHDLEREAEERRAGEEKVRALLTSIPDTVARLSRDGVYVEFKPGANAPVSIDLTGKHMSVALPPDIATMATLLIATTLETRELQHFEFRIDSADGPRDYEGRMVPSGADEVVAMVRDITDRKRAETSLRAAYDDLARSKQRLQEQSSLLELALASEREQARRDSLTGLLNHGAITDEIQRLLADDGDATFAVVMIDVDGMKATNDTFGHISGDLLLRYVANALRGDGAITGRYGGDEFIVLLPGRDRDAAGEYIAGVRARLDAGSIADPETGMNVPVNVSMGIAAYPQEAGTITDLVALADAAMYSAKRQRPSLPGEITPPRPLADDRAARMVGEVVPLLTSPGDLRDKLRMVSHRLSTGGDYDAVNVVMFMDDDALLTNVYARLPEDILAAWRADQAAVTRDHELHGILDRTRRPLILHDIANDPGLRDSERALLAAGGMRSVLAAPLVWRDELCGVLAVATTRERAFGPAHAGFLMAVAAQVTAIVKTAALVDQLEAATERLAASQAETVMMLAAAAEAHDRTAGMHLQGIRKLVEALACELGYEESAIADLGLAAVLHDIGKVSVPESVLASTGALDDGDWETMKQHTVWGAGFLAGRPGFQLAATVARSHHERWDGGGYPDGLRGDAIPLAAAIVTVADSFTAMTHDRPYREGRTLEDAIAEVRSCSGTQFHPAVVDALLRLHERRALPYDGDAPVANDEDARAA